MMIKPIPTLMHFLINLAKPYKGLFSLIALIGMFWALINTFLPYTLKLIIDHVVSFDGVKADLFRTTQPLVLTYIAFIDRTLREHASSRLCEVKNYFPTYDGKRDDKNVQLS